MDKRRLPEAYFSSHILCGADTADLATLATFLCLNQSLLPAAGKHLNAKAVRVGTFNNGSPPTKKKAPRQLAAHIVEVYQAMAELLQTKEKGASLLQTDFKHHFDTRKTVALYTKGKNKGKAALFTDIIDYRFWNINQHKELSKKLNEIANLLKFGIEPGNPFGGKPTLRLVVAPMPLLEAAAAAAVGGGGDSAAGDGGGGSSGGGPAAGDGSGSGGGSRKRTFAATEAVDAVDLMEA